MEKKRKKKKRKKRRLKPTGLFSPIARASQSILNLIISNVYIIVIVIVVLVGLKAAHNLFLTSSYFVVNEVEMLCVENGKAVADSEVNLHLEKGINIFKVNLRKCQHQIEGVHPELKNIKVNRVLPDKIAVFFQKRIPICQVRSTKYYLVDKDAVVLPKPEKRAYGKLPIVTNIHINESQLPQNRRLQSADMQKAIALIQQIAQTDFTKQYKIAEIDVYDRYNPIIQLENGIQIKMGKRSFIKTKPALMEVLKDLETKGLKPKSIDMRFDDIIVTPK